MLFKRWKLFYFELFFKCTIPHCTALYILFMNNRSIGSVEYVYKNDVASEKKTQNKGIFLNLKPVRNAYKLMMYNNKIKNIFLACLHFNS